MAPELQFNSLTPTEKKIIFHPPASVEVKARSMPIIKISTRVEWTHRQGKTFPSHIFLGKIFLFAACRPGPIVCVNCASFLGTWRNRLSFFREGFIAIAVGDGEILMEQLLPSNHFLTLTTSYNRTMFSTFPSEERCGWKFYSGWFLLLPQAFFPFVRISREVNELFLVIRKEKWLHGAWKAWKSFAFSSF